MARLQIYCDDELVQESKRLRLPVSQICREALTEAIEEQMPTNCKKCKGKSHFQVRGESGAVFACKDHVALFLRGDFSTVRAL
jgi:hypothetical protein